jgi:hypothetical protein
LILNYLLDKCSRYVLQMLQRDIANSHEWFESDANKERSYFFFF